MTSNHPKLRLRAVRFLPLAPLAAAALFFCAGVLASAAADPRGSRPNIVLIMCDDAGFADFGFTGGPVDTPVLDRLRSEGMLFTRAYNNARCMPTRASLMTGVNPEKAGEGPLENDVVTIPEVLRTVGYANYMVGKWHLGYPKDVDRDTGLVSIPTGRGFDRFYGIWQGAAQVNKPNMMRIYESAMAEGKTKTAVRIVEDGRLLDWDEVPDDYYNTFTWTEKAIEHIKSTPGDRPVFLYAAYTAPHWPLDPLPEYRARYEGRFDEGWDVVRNRVFERQKELGIVPRDYPQPPPEWGIRPWEEADEKSKSVYTKGSEMYYASIEEMDTAIGRLLDALKETGRYDNTLLLFFSDNGADNAIGGAPRGHTSNTPHMGYKLTYYEGGANTPLVAWWPGVVPAGTTTDQQVILEDMMATFVELAGATYPAEAHGKAIHAVEGRSFVPSLMDPADTQAARTHCWSHDGQRGVLKGDWKAVLLDARHPAIPKYFGPERGGWYLYHHKDGVRLEVEDLKDRYPEKMEEMIAEFRKWAEATDWAPTLRFGPHPTDEANGLRDYSKD